MPDRPPVFDDREDAVLTEVVGALVESERALAELEGCAHRAVRRGDARRPAAVGAPSAGDPGEGDGAALDRGGDRRRAAMERPHCPAAAQRGTPARRRLPDHGAGPLRRQDQRAPRGVIRDVGTELVDPTLRAAFEALVVTRAASDTAAGTRAFVRALLEELHPASITERFESAEQQRRVWMEDGVDGMARLGVIDGAAKIRAMYDRLTQQARAIRVVARAEAEVGDIHPDAVQDRRTTGPDARGSPVRPRPHGQPAVDPTAGTLPGGLGAIRANVSVIVPALTAAGATDRGASIDGLSPIDADTARRLLAGAPAWDRLVTHPSQAAPWRSIGTRPLPRPATVRPSPRRALQVPWMPSARSPVRPRPQPRPCARRPHRPVQSGLPVQTTSHVEDRDAMGRSPAPRRHHRMDESARPPSNRPSGTVRGFRPRT